MTGNWSTPLSAPLNVGLMLLLTDGSVLAQNCGTSLWWRLRPDRLGGYSQGEWKPTGASTSAPLYFASAVLGDGSVLIAGGEYSNNAAQPSDLCTVEAYDPLAETWSTLPTPPGWTSIGDAPCCVLPDGKLLLGNINASSCAIWDPKAAAWTATGAKNNASSSEETWTLLPDGSVLTADCQGEPNSERFLNGAWTPNDQTPVHLVEAASSEIGPAILLTDGSVIAIGATGATARFVPNADPSQAGSWSAGPIIPQAPAGAALGAKDAPACLLPNGRVLCAVGPVDGLKDTYAGPTTFFEFDPSGAAGGAWSGALPAPPGDTGLAPYNFTFLLLPTGEVLVSNGTPTVQVFQPDGAPDPAWAPSIESCPTDIQPGTAYTLQGSQLNGLSQACSYGDDAAMATNYPIVRLRAGSPSNTILYCRTSGHSTMGVATGAALQSTNFAVPPGTAPGIYQLSVIANGIASIEVPVNVAASAAPTPSGRSRTFEEELFYRDLSEVHLLIDFVSGRQDKSLVGLKESVDADIHGKAESNMTPQRIVEQICEITYPPTGGPKANAEQAAFMLMVKDKLNFLASPARGLTVAYTSMFAEVSLSYENEFIKRAVSWLRSKMDIPEPGLGEPKVKFFSAKAAYPNLERPARRFRAFYARLPWFALVAVALIIYTNWDISVTSGALHQISAARDGYQKRRANSALATSPKCVVSADSAEAARPLYCDADTALGQLQAGRANLRALVDPTDWWRPVPFSVRVLGLGCKYFPTCLQSVSAAPPSIVAPEPQEMLTLDVVSGLNTIFIPTAFGFLGTLVGLMRSIAAKMRDSILAPRDYMVSRIGASLGMSAGLAVGLFLNGGGGSIANGLGNTITITVAGLSFLAGFGAESFFSFMDGLLARIFVTGQSTGAGPPK